MVNREGFRIGALAVCSYQPRTLTSDEIALLEALADLLEMILDKRQMMKIKDSILEVATSERSDYADRLTGVCNSRGLNFLFKRELASRHRRDNFLVVGAVDIDNFASLAEKYGTDFANQAIRLSADLLVRWSRKSDIVARIDGDEFVVVAFNAIPMMIPVLGEKLLHMFRANARVDTADGPVPFTISIGFVAAIPPKYSKGLLKFLVSDAHAALAIAKERGRNRYEISNIPDSVYSDVAMA